jgi:uncharacterized protein
MTAIKEDVLCPGEWMQTFSGIAFWPLTPCQEDIFIEDIAHSLSLQCRFAGHTREFYSVAQHSVIVASIVPPEHSFWALMHDASEAYLVDFPRPIKDASRLGDEYKAIESNLMRTICRRFLLPLNEPECIREADNRVLMTEARDLLRPAPMTWKNKAVPLDELIEPWPAKLAESQFLSMANRFISQKHAV